MLRISIASLLAFLMTACTSNGTTPDATPGIDAPPGPDAPVRPDAAARCNPVAQDCATDVKFTIVTRGNELLAQCVAVTGTKGNGEDCMREAEGGEGTGHDDCAAGGFCSGFASFGDSRVCAPLCRSSVDCPSGQSCVASTTTSPPDGFCVSSCTLFSDECPEGWACSDLIADIASTDQSPLAFAKCVIPGTKGLGQACMDGECMADLICRDLRQSGTATCVQLCDSVHACTTAGEECVALPDLDHDGGLCFSVAHP